MRKIIQICESSVPESYPAHPAGTELHALCNDGTVWSLSFSGGEVYGWSKFPDIPQPEDEDNG